MTFALKTLTYTIYTPHELLLNNEVLASGSIFVESVKENTHGNNRVDGWPWLAYLAAVRRLLPSAIDG